MKRKVEMNLINVKKKTAKKFLLINIFIVFLVSCLTTKDYYIISYENNKEFRKYSNDGYCFLYPLSNYSFLVNYKHYSEKKCLKINFNLNSKEINNIKKKYIQILKQKTLYRKKIFTHYPKARLNHVIWQNDTLSTSKSFGLLQIIGPKGNLYFIRTENGIFFYDCDNKENLFIELDNSKMIRLQTKEKIKEFINNICTKKSLFWINAKYY